MGRLVTIGMGLFVGMGSFATVVARQSPPLPPAQSGAVAKEVADLMTKNPTWTLRVEGHTDNIGGNTYNVDLSGRRSDAVKQALVETYKIAADRLTTSGFGASRPKETNDTIEGRARNRRVELVLD